MVKKPPANGGLIPGSGRSLEKEMATHSSILAWEIPCTEEPGGLSPWGLQMVGHDLVTKQQQKKTITKELITLRFFTTLHFFMHPMS